MSVAVKLISISCPECKNGRLVVNLCPTGESFKAHNCSTCNQRFHFWYRDGEKQKSINIGKPNENQDGYEYHFFVNLS